MTDFVVSTDLIVLGMSFFDGGQTFDGQTIIDVDDAEAFLVRKDGDAGDVFIIDTISDVVLIPQSASQFAIGRSSIENFVQFHLDGSLISGGGSNFAAGALFASDITSADGDTRLSQIRAGVSGGGSLTTPGTGTSLFAATLILDEPNITLTGGDAMANAATLFITGQPTEGTSNNYGIFNAGGMRTDGTSDFFGAITQPGASSSFSLGTGVAQTFARMAFVAAFVSSGINNHAEMLFLGGSVTGFAVDTVSLAGLLADVSITTQGNSDTIADVAQVIIQEPNITIGAGDTVTNASTLALLGSPTEGTNNFALRSTGAALTLFAGVQFTIGRSTSLDRWQFLLTGGFTSDGSVNESAKFRVEDSLTGAPGDTAGMVGGYFDATFVTQTATENIADISQVRIDPPGITDNLTGDITNAQSLALFSSPTAGLNNWTLRSTGIAPTIFRGLQFAIGRTTLEDWHQFVIDGAFVSGGSASEADILKLQGTLTGAPGDGSLHGVFFTTNIITQTATESIADISQVKIDEPGITDNLTGDITRAQTLLLNGSPTEGLTNFALRSTGAAPTLFAGLQFVIGTTTVLDTIQFQLTGSFTSGGSGVNAQLFALTSTLIGASGDTGSLACAFFNGNITTQAATENIADVSQVRIDEPNITDNLTGDVTTAQTLFIVGSPTEGLSNFTVRSIGAAPSLFQGLQFVIGDFNVDDFVQVHIGGIFTSGGSSTTASKFVLDGTIIGASGDITALNGALLSARITTQTASETIADISGVRIDQPSIIDNLTGGGLITRAYTLFLSGSPTQGVSNFSLKSSGAAPTQFAGLQFVIGDASLVIDDFNQILFGGAFTSGGSSDRMAKVRIEGRITGAPGDTNFIHYVSIGAAITTQTATENIANIASLNVDEPNIGDNLTGDITNAQTLLLSNTPTEGEDNFAIRSLGGAGCIFAGQSFIIGTAVFTTNDQVLITGAFTSTGLTTGAKFKVAGGFTGSSGLTSTLNGAFFDTSVATQTADEVISDVGQVRIDDPSIINNLTGSGFILSAYTLFLAGSPTEGVNNFALRSVGPAPSIFGGPRFVIGSISVAGVLDRFGVLFTGNITSDGASNFAEKFRLEGSLTGASGDTVRLIGSSFDNTITTQAVAEVITDVAQVRINEPNIAIGAGSSITTAQTLLLLGSPTEGTNNFALRSTGSAPTLFIGTQFVIGSSNVTDRIQVLLTGNFTSGGGSVDAQTLTLNGTLTGAPGDTGFLAGAYFTTAIFTQTATENISDISQVRIDEPTITDNLTGDITIAQTLLLSSSPTEALSNFTFRSEGPAPSMFQGLQFIIGPGPKPAANFRQVLFTGNFTSGGGATEATKFRLEGILAGASGDTTRLSGAEFAASVSTQAVAEVITNVSQVHIEEPSITLGAGSSITNAQTLLIVAAPTEGVNNFALRVASGLSQFGGTVQGANGSSFALLNVTSTATVPTLIPNRASTTTGIGGVSGEIALIVSSTAGIKLRSGGRLTFGDVINQDSMYLNVGGIVVGGSGGESFGSRFHITKTAVAGSTSLLADFMLDGSVRTQTAAESIANIAFLNIEGDIQDNLTGGGLITVASALRIANPPTEGVTNFAINVVSGDVFLGGNLTVSGAGPHAIGGTPSGIIGLIISETFTSDGAATLASGVFITQTLVGASGDTTSLTGVTFISAITTQTATENIANISQVEINEPFISDNLTGDITNAQTLLIVNAPTEGLSNFAIRVISGDVSFGGNILVGGDGPHGYSSGITAGFSQSTFAGSFTSDGSFNQASGTLFGSVITSDIGDGALAQVRIRGNLTTPGGGATPTVATLMLDEPVITVGGGDAVGTAATLLINSAPTEATSNFGLLVNGGARFNDGIDIRGNSAMSAGLTFTIGSGTIQDFAQVALLGTFTSSGSSNKTASLQIQTTQTAVAGDTLLIAALNIEPLLVTQGVTEVIGNVASVIIDEPNISVGTGDTITNASTLVILGAPTEGVANWAFRIVSGDVNFGGDLIDIGTGGGNIDILFRGCSTFFLGTLSSPEEMFFGVGSTVSVNDAAMSLAQNVRFRLKSTVGDFSEVKRNSFVVQLNVAAPSVTIAGAIPAGSFVFGITARVIGAITGPTGFDIGDGVDVDRWGNSISGSLGTTVDITDATDDTVTTFPTANDVVITSDGVDFSAGELRIVIHYLDLSAPTS